MSESRFVTDSGHFDDTGKDGVFQWLTEGPRATRRGRKVTVLCAESLCAGSARQALPSLASRQSPIWELFLHLLSVP